VPVLSTGDWIALLGSLVTVVAGYGALRAKVAQLDAGQRELREGNQRSNEDQGRRLGALERWREAAEAVERERLRTKTSARGHAQEGSDE
jgi:hypothetical protein